MKTFLNIQQKTSLVHNLPLAAIFCVATFPFKINNTDDLIWCPLYVSSSFTTNI